MAYDFTSGGRESSVRYAVVKTEFDAERDTPELIDWVDGHVPSVREVMESLRNAVPLVPHSGVGPVGSGGFFRIPNHYRSVSYVLPAREAGNVSSGVIVFKGTEPLLPDFPEYLDWMLRVPFRSSGLPLGLHFPLEMKLPPAAMWIEEALAEQTVASRLQQEYLRRYGRIAKLPLPLFVFRMTREQVDRYQEIVVRRLSGDALSKIRNKLTDGLGIEVYYYPELPVRVADLFVGNVRDAFKAALAPDLVEDILAGWAQLFSEMLCLNYMPYASWHRGMGGCCDSGNACIDGGFHDLLTLVPFDTIPDDVTFRQCLNSSIRMLSESMSSLAAAAVGSPAQVDAEVASFAAAFISDRLRTQLMIEDRDGRAVDVRLKRFCSTPTASDIIPFVRQILRGRSLPTQFIGGTNASSDPVAKFMHKGTSSG